MLDPIKRASRDYLLLLNLPRNYKYLKQRSDNEARDICDGQFLPDTDPHYSKHKVIHSDEGSKTRNGSDKD